MSMHFWGPLLPGAGQQQSGPVVGGNGQIKYWDSAAWTLKPVKYWSGASWVAKPLKYFTGSVWVSAK